MMSVHEHQEMQDSARVFEELCICLARDKPQLVSMYGGDILFDVLRSRAVFDGVDGLPVDVKEIKTAKT